jgi:hypothetical protein
MFLVFLVLVLSAPVGVAADNGLRSNRTFCVNSSDLVWNSMTNQPSIIGTFIKCLENVQDAMIAPYYEDSLPINVSTQIYLNNLIQINEISSSVELDFQFFIGWVKFSCNSSIVHNTRSNFCTTFRAG